MADSPKQAVERPTKIAMKRPAVQPAVQEPLVLDEPGLVTSAQRAVLDSGRTRPDDVLALQRMAGNRAVHSAVRPSGSSTVRASTSFERALAHWPSVQAKLTVGPAGDVYEQEADRVAEQVLAMPVTQSAKSALAGGGHAARRQPEEEEELQGKPIGAFITPLVRRQEEEQLQGKRQEIPLRRQEEEELQGKRAQGSLQRQEEEEQLQEKRERIRLQRQPDGGFDAKPEVAERLAARRGAGQSLPADTRAYMEPRFGADFSGVRVHSDPEAADLSRSLGAQAFTHGQDVYMGAGKYDPGTTAGKRLLAHELTHIVQQGKASVRSQSAGAIARRSTGTIQRIGGRLEKLKKGFKEKIGKRLSSAAHTVAEKAREAPGAIASAAGTAKGGIVTAGKTVGKPIVSLLQWIGKKAYGVHVGLTDEVEPVKQPTSLSLEPAHAYAGELLYAIDGHKHQVSRSLSFLQQDEIAIEELFQEAVKSIERKKRSLQDVKEPTGRLARLRKSAGEQRAKLQGQIARLTTLIGELQAETPKAQERTSQAQQGQEILSDLQLLAGIVYDDVLGSYKKREPLTEEQRARIKQTAQNEEHAVNIRNTVTEEVNNVRKSGRSERLFTTGIVKLIGGKIANVALQTATLTTLGVESKDRPGGYSSTVKISSIFSKTKAEFQRLRAIAGSKLYGNRGASALYATLKGASTLVVAPLRNLAGSMGLLSTLLGVGLGIVTLGTAAAPFVAAAAILGYIALGLTGLNAILNGALAIWNGIRLKTLQNQFKRGQLASETSETAATAITEVGAAGAMGLGIGVNVSAITKEMGPEAAQQVLKGIAVEDKPLWIPIVKVLAEKGVDIPSQAIPGKAASAVSPGGLGYKEAHQTGLLKPGYRPHASHGVTIGGRRIGVPHPKFLTETLPSAASSAAHTVHKGAVTAKDALAQKSTEFNEWSAKELRQAREAAKRKLDSLADEFSTRVGQVTQKLAKLRGLGEEISNKFAAIKARFSKSKEGTQDEQKAVELADMGTSLGPSMADWFGSMPDVLAEADRWASLQAQEEEKTP